MISDIEDSNANGHISDLEAKKAVQGVQKEFPQGIPKCGTDALRLGLCIYDVKSKLLALD